MEKSKAKYSEQLRVLGVKKFASYFFFQRILRVNSDVPWPVHYTSQVIHPDRITRHAPTSYVGSSIGCYIQANNGIEIGRNVRIGPHVKIVSADHDLYDYDKHEAGKGIKIGDNCWIGAGATILPGVVLGEHVIVGAGAVVTKSFSGNCVIAGVPAKKVRDIGEYKGETFFGQKIR